MKRNLEALANEEYDLVVIGAGIYGVTTAWDASLRGLKVALIDKGDFASATSANSLKTMHGGLRYLQTADLKRFRESVHERMVLMRIAPNFVYPLPVMMPTYSWKLKSRPVMACGLLANDILAIDRNRLSDPHKYVPGSHTMSSKKVKELIPGYDKYNMNGGALWYDCQAYNTERFALHFVISAVKQGLNAANYVKADGMVITDGAVTAVKAVDELTGKTFEIKTKMVVNNAGPWVDKVLQDVSGKDAAPKFQLSSAMNLVIDRDLMGEYAAGLSGPWHHTFASGKEYNGFRILFFAPWRGKTIIGTNHLPYKGDADTFKVTEAEIVDFLKTVNTAHPGANLKREEISYFYSGFLPMTGTSPKTGEVKLEPHYKLYDHSKTDKVDGIVTVVGVKYTTARDVARKTVDLVYKKLKRRVVACQTEKVRLYGGNIDLFDDFLTANITSQPFGLGEAAMQHLSYNYGSAITEILDYGEQDEALMKLMPESDEVVRAEILHGVREEMAMKLADVVMRRTDLGSASCPADATLATAADIMGAELGWDESRKSAEIEATKKIYQPV